VKGQLRISDIDMNDIFSRVSTAVMNLLNRHRIEVEDTEGRSIDKIILLGGFASSPFLQSRAMIEMAPARIITPSELFKTSNVSADKAQQYKWGVIAPGAVIKARQDALSKSVPSFVKEEEHPTSATHIVATKSYGFVHIENSTDRGEPPTK
jgi:hypothetical protein